MHEFWEHRYRCFVSLVWWVSLRYFTIGWEYIFRLSDSSLYWEFFADVLPQAVGAYMVLVGAAGIASQIFAWRTRLLPVSLLRIFAIGVCLHSLFRISVLVQNKVYGDPLLILFMCDFGAMLFILLGLPAGRKIIPCK